MSDIVAAATSGSDMGGAISLGDSALNVQEPAKRQKATSAFTILQPCIELYSL
ncbi:MAG: hypothetical protein JW841_00950 [Deltaproteobacteria bacterium]|nr:hypothetical protein [Deltaproteobacteria bacterium]